MTTSSGKTLKRKINENDEEMPEKRLATGIMGDKPEITITLKAKETEVV
jgi:hypothetical protein